MLDSLKAPFTRVSPGPPFLRLGGLIIRGLAVVVIAGTLGIVGLVLVPMTLVAGANGVDRIFFVIASLVCVMTLALGTITVSMLGTTLRLWEARHPRGRQYATTLGVLALLMAVSPAIALGQDPARGAAAYLFLLAAAGAALLTIGLHPAGKALADDEAL